MDQGAWFDEEQTMARERYTQTEGLAVVRTWADRSFVPKVPVVNCGIVRKVNY